VKHRKTDYGTIILHWLLVAAFGIALLTGLRIAAEAPDRTWINVFDIVLPHTGVWSRHMQAAIVLVAVAVAYTIYLVRSGLSRRVQLDKIRMRGLFGRKQARLGAVAVILNWIFFVTMLSLIASGGLLYFGIYAGHDVAIIHWWATWGVLAFAAVHILTHYKIGGASQLLRIFRPERLPVPPPRLDAVELLAMLVEQSTRLNPESAGIADGQPQRPAQPSHPPTQNRSAPRRAVAQADTPMARRASKPRNATFQSNPFVVAAAVAITGASVLAAADWFTIDRLQIHRIDRADAPVLDGDTSDHVWRNIHPYSLMTNEGGNFDGKGESRVEVRAVHDGTWAYFLFTWEDPTRSLKQLPLIKEIDGWHLLQNGHQIGDEHDYNEDKFSVLLTRSDALLAGDRTFHAGSHPVANAPSTMTGRGLHFTAADSDYVDVWQWKATSSGPTGWMDDEHFGPPLDPTPLQVRNAAPYRGGFAPDPGTPNYSDNFVVEEESAGALITPRRLPKDLAATVKAMGEISLDPNAGESEGARWFMTEAESVPYSSELDMRIPVGTVLPGIIITGDFTGDRADVRCAARWASGHWALEVARRLDTQSKYDVPLQTGIFMRVAAFDHSEIRHTRHVRPIRLEVE
jgi:hypothetical protein